MRAAFLLNNVLGGGGKQVLIDLFRSNVELDRETRDAIADALEREDGIRLELVMGAGRPAFYTDRLKTWHEYQEIADEVAALIASGDVPKAAKSKVMERRGIGEAKLKKALAYRRRSPVSIAYKPRTGSGEDA